MSITQLAKDYVVIHGVISVFGFISMICVATGFTQMQSVNSKIGPLAVALFIACYTCIASGLICALALFGKSIATFKKLNAASAGLFTAMLWSCFTFVGAAICASCGKTHNAYSAAAVFLFIQMALYIYAVFVGLTEKSESSENTDSVP
ncbi:hypothetical protein GJ496_000902 [Pomphorhynchus laevis]|nr:hypothetical protein GJ496_000902 [Pomphorhynchus laevis]